MQIVSKVSSIILKEVHLSVATGPVPSSTTAIPIVASSPTAANQVIAVQPSSTALVISVIGIHAIIETIRSVHYIVTVIISSAVAINTMSSLDVSV